MIDAKKIQSLFQRSWAERDTWQGNLREVYAYALPHRNPYMMVDNPGQNVQDTAGLLDGTLQDATENLANRLQSKLVPPGAQWFDFKVERDFNDEFLVDMSQEDASKMAGIVSRMIDASNFSSVVSSFFLDAIVGGMAVLRVEEGFNKMGQTVLEFETIPQNEVAIAYGKANDVVEVHRRFSVQGYRLAHMFLGNDSAEKMAETYAKQRVTIHESLVRAGGNDPEGMAWTILTTCKEASKGENGGVIRHEEMACSPFIVYHWSRINGETYGSSPAMRALPFARTLNAVKKNLLSAGMLAANPMFLVDEIEDLNLNFNKVRAGGVIQVQDMNSIRQLPVTSQPHLSQFTIADYQQVIRRVMYDRSLPEAHEGVRSASEIIARTNEITQDILAAMMRFINYVAYPIIRLSMDVAVKRGAITQEQVDLMTLDGVNTTLVINSPLARAQRNEDVQNLIAYSQLTGGMGLNQVEFMREVALGMNIPKHVLLNEKDAKAQQEQMAQAQAQQPQQGQ